MAKRTKHQMYRDGILNCYRELYKKATPSVDFDELMASTPLDERGLKVIDFSAYKLNRFMYEDIVDKHIKRNKLKGPLAQSFRTEMYMGCGPKRTIEWN
jgi:hypothetical protein